MLDPTEAETALCKEWVVLAGMSQSSASSRVATCCLCLFLTQTSQCMWLMQALGFLLSALQVEEILKNLHSLITPYIQQLEKLADETVSALVLLPSSRRAASVGCVPGVVYQSSTP